MKTFYISTGPLRGECGHHHRTEEAAEACNERDHIRCGVQGGYGDRCVLVVEPGKAPALPPDLAWENYQDELRERDREEYLHDLRGRLGRGGMGVDD